MLKVEMGKMDMLFDGADHDYYPAWVCSSCGAKYGRRRCGTACWHVGVCGICGIETSVTEPRDFGHLQTGWREMKLYHATTQKKAKLYRQSGAIDRRET